jgi:hypothetical protein
MAKEKLRQLEHQYNERFPVPSDFYAMAEIDLAQ